MIDHRVERKALTQVVRDMLCPVGISDTSQRQCRQNVYIPSGRGIER